MKQSTLFILLSLLTLNSFGQDTSGLKSVRKYQGNEIRLAMDYDINGNCVFEKNDGLYGPVKMIWSTGFDSLNRKIRAIWAHCNVGFEISEIEYEKGMAKTFYYTVPNLKLDSSTKAKYSRGSRHPYEFIESINTKKELEDIDLVKKLLAGKRLLRSITFLDSNEKKIRRFSFEENGDTTIEIYKNSWWQIKKHTNEQQEKYKTNIEEEFDTNGNLLKQLRTQANGIKEDYYYKYSKTNKVIEETRIINKSFDYKVVTIYNKKDLKILQYVFAKDSNNLVCTIKFKYDKKGKVVKEESNDKRKDLPERTYLYKTRYEYWKK